jgi:AAA15 family ATPase/GTPase
MVRIAALNGRGLMLDEFNSQLHPLLQKYIIDLFYETSTTGQLIFTTHDTTLLDKQFMRRDQIWFVSKDERGESSLYSLADFKVRNDKSFGKDYLSGVYGGIPILSKFSFGEDDNGNR